MIHGIRLMFVGVLMVTATRGEAEAPTVPKSKAGANMVGTELPLEELRWLNTENEVAPDITGRVTLVRWWTDTCPYCATSLPAITALEEAYSSQGFQTAAVYHPKPPRAVKNDAVLANAKRFDYESAIAVDDDWAVLQRAYLDTGSRKATSVSFLLDGEGKIRYVHPGPELRPGKGRREANLQTQYDDMRKAIEALLAELPKTIEE